MILAAVPVFGQKLKDVDGGAESFRNTEHLAEPDSARAQSLVSSDFRTRLLS